MTRVLVVEDETPLRRTLAMNLAARGYAVSEAATAAAALTVFADQAPDIVLLDLGLPDRSGTDVITALRQFTIVPVIVLSARSGSTDKVAALDLGANDYVTKPFDMNELLARLRAHSRPTTAPESDALIGGTRIDLTTTTAIDASGTPVHLTPTEWKILGALVHRPGALVSSDTLLTAVRGGTGYTDPSYLRSYLAQLRRKLEPEPSRPRHLITEPGMGYRYRP